ncbi:MAG: PrsW family glutamic-type intramembrane protease [Capsulimonadaceae bacterium]
MANATVRVVDGPDKGKVFVIARKITSIGLGDGCDIRPSSSHERVSRKHALITWDQDGKNFIVEDNASTNGIYVEWYEKKVKRTRLRAGKWFQLGDFVAVLDIPADGPDFEDEPAAHRPDADSAGGLRLTSYLPILSATATAKTGQIGWITPGLVTVATILVLFATIGSLTYLYVLAGYIAFLTYYAVYAICGSAKPAWVIAAPALITFLVIGPDIRPDHGMLTIQGLGPVFNGIAGACLHLTPGAQPGSTEPFPVRLWYAVVGVGFPEELTKAVPILIALCVTMWIRKRPAAGESVSPLAITGPIDGILIGASSAISFIIVETMYQYVPSIVQAGGQLGGVELLIPRIIGGVCGHIAWAGFIGYAVGTAVIRPKDGWKLVIVSFLLSAGLHGVWDAISFGADRDSLMSRVITFSVGAVSFALLMSAILKARSIQPAIANAAAIRSR